MKVVDGEIGAPELFATIYRAVGINHEKKTTSSAPGPSPHRARHPAGLGGAGLSVCSKGKIAHQRAGKMGRSD